MPKQSKPVPAEVRRTRSSGALPPLPAGLSEFEDIAALASTAELARREVASASGDRAAPLATPGSPIPGLLPAASGDRRPVSGSIPLTVPKVPAPRDPGGRLLLPPPTLPATLSMGRNPHADQEDDVIPSGTDNRSNCGNQKARAGKNRRGKGGSSRQHMFVRTPSPEYATKGSRRWPTMRVRMFEVSWTSSARRFATFASVRPDDTPSTSSA